MTDGECLGIDIWQGLTRFGQTLCIMKWVSHKWVAADLKKAWAVKYTIMRSEYTH